MNIVIIGAGEVGRNIAGTLANEQHNVYLVEQNEDKARSAEEELDVRVIRGNGARPQVLSEAGISEE
ncbi:MAG: NAD-binding protein, partial [Synergistaceae bacterium]|nr:NAD-binding protein [Synergistaceae bacterium]